MGRQIEAHRTLPPAGHGRVRPRTGIDPGLPMSGAPGAAALAGLRRLRWGGVGASVGVVVLVLLLAPHWFYLKFVWAQVAVPAAAVGYLSRRRILDGVLFAAAYVACAIWVEAPAGIELLVCLSLTILVLTGRPRFSLLAGCVLLGLLVIGSHVKLRAGGSVLTWQDVRYFLMRFGDNIGVFASQPTLVMYALAAIAASGAAMVLTWRMEGPGPSHAFDTRTLLRWGLSLVVVLWCASDLQDGARGIKGLDAWMMGQKSIHRPVTTFLSTLDMEPRAQFARARTDGFAQAVRHAEAAGATGVGPADIVVFLQESQFNPQSVTGCPASLCAVDVFGASAGTTDFGEMRVHTRGGGTWLSEFALATGLPHDVYGLAGTFAPFNLAPGVNRSLVRSLKAAGYRTIAVYPVGGGMMNARAAYRGYGFDEFYDARDLGLPGHYFTPDREVHEAAVKVLQSARTGGKPVFLLALTIFNHSEHGIKMERVPADLVGAARGVFGRPVEADNLADYVWRSREFSAAYASTRAAVLDSARPAVLAWFGDHQPSFMSAPELRGTVRSGAGRGIPSGFITWYNVATNVGAPFRSRAQPLDIAFLPGLLAQRAGAPLDEWLRANVLARERCQGLLVECAAPEWRDAYLTYVLDDLRAIR